jgi:hypothetical protein
MSLGMTVPIGAHVSRIPPTLGIDYVRRTMITAVTAGPGAKKSGPGLRDYTPGSRRPSTIAVAESLCGTV